MYYIFVYDVNEKRVNKVHKYLKMHMIWVQNSVFEGELTKAELETVKVGLKQKINEEEDSVLIFGLNQKWMKKQVIGLELNPTDNIL